MSKKIWKSLENKMLIIMLFAGIILSASIYFTNFSQHYTLTIKKLQQDAVNVHKYAENIVDTSSFTYINTIEDEETELYINTWEQLDEIRRIANILYLYTIKLNDNNEFIYVIDAMDKDDENFCNAGTLVEEEFHLMLNKCLNDEVVFGSRIEKTDYGIVYPVFFPFHDSKGDVIGVIGIDFNCEELYHSMNRTRWISILLTAFFLCTFTVILFLSVKKVVRHTEIEFVKIEKEATDSNNKMMGEIEYRSKLLNVSNEMALLLHKSDMNSFDNALKQSMSAISKLIKVDSISLWKNRITGNELYCFQIFDYSVNESKYQNHVPYKYDDFIPEWKETLAKGIQISGLVSEMSPKTRANFAPTGLLSALIMPIFLEEQFWGFVCFDDYQKERVFTKDEETILHSVTLMLTNAFLRNRMIRKINENTIKLEAALEAAEQSSRSKDIFLAQMSHEIRTPMNAILGITEIQLRSNEHSEDMENGLIMIYESGTLLLNIINNILDLSKIDAGKLEIVPEKYDIPSLINDIVQLNRMRYDSKPIDFKLSIDESIPVELIGDEFRIKQIFNNLLSNAYKYTDAGEINMSVTAEYENDTVMLIIRISDTGQGMNESQISRLFDEYARFNIERNRNIAGTGLGMNITKRIIDIMNGEITVESEVDKGTAFTVRLPQKRSGSQECGSEITEKLQTFCFRKKIISKMAKITHDQMPNGRVLVVDDVHTNLFVAQGLLLPYGLAVETANSGFEAIEKIKNGTNYDIVFMDHMMPKMDGITAVKIIREWEAGQNNENLRKQLVIVALTANAVVGQAEIFLANGFDAFIAKPIDSCELDQLLTKYIKLSAANNTDISSKVEKIFNIDAENTLSALSKLSANLNDLSDEELETYIVIVHGIKSALASIGEKELSIAAFKLEQAGGEKNFNFLASETPDFINKLSLLNKKYKSKETNNNAEISGEDMVFLLEKLDNIRIACESYNTKAAKTALGELKQKVLISDICDEISVGLLRGEFKKVVSIIENAVEMIKNNKQGE